MGNQSSSSASQAQIAPTTNNTQPVMSEEAGNLTLSAQHYSIDSDIVAYFPKYQKGWINSKQRERLIDKLKDSTPQGGWNIDKAVCMALGPLNKHLSLQQLVVFMDMVDFITKSGPYKHFLHTLGITVLEAPNAERMIRRGVFSFVPLWKPEYQLLGRSPGLQPSLHVGKSPAVIRKDCHKYNHQGWSKVRPLLQEGKFTKHESSMIRQVKLYSKQVESLTDDYTCVRMHGDPKEFGEIFEGIIQLSMYVERDHEAVTKDPWPEQVADSDLLNIGEDESICPCCLLPAEEENEGTAKAEADAEE